jgi:small ligand-binding sensory domain FIST
MDVDPHAPGTRAMRWTSALSLAPQLERAVGEVLDQARAGLGGAAPDLALLFAGAQHAAEYERVPALVADRLGGGLLVGCSAGGVIGGEREIEDRAALALVAALLPGIEVRGFHLGGERVPQAQADRHAWERALGVAAAADPHFVLLGDPFTADAESVLAALDGHFPRAVKVGGLASGMEEAGGGALFLGTSVHRSGTVGVALSGDVAIDAIVAQGCRPIGDPMFVTGCQRNVLRELDGRPAARVLKDLYERLAPPDRELARRALFLGVAMRAAREEYRQGDFLIRNIAGMDGATGALAIGAVLQDGAVVQFHLRDAATSAEDLRTLLGRHQGAALPPAAGALLFSCLGRGAGLYGHPNHDSDAFRAALGAVPLGGFFCNGEIGPVHGTTFLHGYTSAFGLFRRRGAAT